MSRGKHANISKKSKKPIRLIFTKKENKTIFNPKLYPKKLPNIIYQKYKKEHEKTR